MDSLCCIQKYSVTVGAGLTVGLGEREGEKMQGHFFRVLCPTQVLLPCPLAQK